MTYKYSDVKASEYFFKGLIIMSKENVKLFLEKIQTDDKLKEALNNESTAINEALESKDVKVLDKIVDVAKNFGYDITTDELISVMVGENNELSMDELDAVSGGVFTQDNINKVLDLLEMAVNTFFPMFTSKNDKEKEPLTTIDAEKKNEEK